MHIYLMVFESANKTPSRRAPVSDQPGALKDKEAGEPAGDRSGLVLSSADRQGVDTANRLLKHI